MFVAIDEENKQVFGPFDSQEQGEGWVREYVRKVEAASWASTPTDLASDFDISEFLWNVQEVDFVDIEDTDFEAFLGPKTDPDPKTVTLVADYIVQSDSACACCRNNADDPEHYHSDLCYGLPMQG